jgi:DNA-binding NtrC family response regulator
MPEAVRSPRRGELLQVLRSVCDEASSSLVPDLNPPVRPAVVAMSPRASAKSSPRSVHPAEVAPMSVRLPELIGDSEQMLEVSRRIRLVAKRKTTVLIQGPTGTGKEVVAHALHRLSPRAERPFVALNCAAIPEALLEAELFGHARGAFTGAVQRRTGRIEAANGGTLFLDEIGEMPLALQSKLLRFLESGELQRVGENEAVRVDVRIIAATHQPLARRAQEGSFRADLFYRLAVFRIQTPALSEHPEDLSALAEHFLKQAAGDEAPKQLSEEAVARLAAHPWPGNVRELQHVLERASILTEDRPVITGDEIEFDLP